MVMGFVGLPLSEPYDSMAFTTSRPSMTAPNTVCFPSSHSVTTVVCAQKAIERVNTRSGTKQCGDEECAGVGVGSHNKEL